MKYLEQACIPLEVRMKLADAALEYAERLVALEEAFWNAKISTEIDAARNAKTSAHNDLLIRVTYAYRAFREAV